MEPQPKALPPPLTSLVGDILPSNPSSLEKQLEHTRRVAENRRLLDVYKTVADTPLTPQYNPLNPFPTGALTPHVLTQSLEEPQRGATPKEIKRFKLQVAKHFEELWGLKNSDKPPKELRTEALVAVVSGLMPALLGIAGYVPAEALVPALPVVVFAGSSSFFIMYLHYLFQRGERQRQIAELESGEDLIRAALAPTMQEQIDAQRPA